MNVSSSTKYYRMLLPPSGSLLLLLLRLRGAANILDFFRIFSSNGGLSNGQEKSAFCSPGAIPYGEWHIKGLGHLGPDLERP